MDRQITFSHSEFSAKKKTTRREKFLSEMDEVVPWMDLIRLIEPYYPKGERGRPPVGIERMLRLYFLQQWYGLSDELLEETIYDSLAMRIFTGIDLNSEKVPDATTLLKFRHLLEKYELTKQILNAVNNLLQKHSLFLREGTIVDATIIEAAPSTKNKSKSRDPEMHQTKKGNEWHFGMKAHIGVDADSGLVHTVVGTAANEADINQTHNLLHGDETVVWSDAGYNGVEKRAEILKKASGINWQVAAKRGSIESMEEGTLKELYRQVETLKASVRAKVEHPFHIIKNLFGYKKTRYRGLSKNTAQIYCLFALANLLIGRKTLLSAD